MSVSIHTRLSRKYFLPATVFTNPYSEMRDESMYLVDESGKSAILCEAIVSIDCL